MSAISSSSGSNTSPQTKKKERTTLASSSPARGATPGRRNQLEEVTSHPFPSFDNSKIAREIADVEREYEQGLEQMYKLLFEAMINFDEWVTARPTLEHERAQERLAEGVRSIAESERKQEMTRQRLAEFVRKMKLALAALTGTEI